MHCQCLVENHSSDALVRCVDPISVGSREDSAHCERKGIDKKRGMQASQGAAGDQRVASWISWAELWSLNGGALRESGRVAFRLAIF